MSQTGVRNPAASTVARIAPPSNLRHFPSSVRSQIATTEVDREVLDRIYARVMRRVHSTDPGAQANQRGPVAAPQVPGLLASWRVSGRRICWHALGIWCCAWRNG
jgi:hypothetical protein